MTAGHGQSPLSPAALIWARTTASRTADRLPRTEPRTAARI